MPNVLVVIGTRPEALKLIPLYKALNSAGFATHLCITSQHNQLLTQVLDLFNVTPDSNLSVMQPEQSLSYLTSTIINGITQVCQTYNPDIIIVQGDTTTAFASALAAFYQKIPIAHIEAGLRTTDPYQPFPEEMNRRLISRLATYHFAPTQSNVAALVKEGVTPSSIFCTGNTIIDTLHWVTQQINEQKLLINPELKHTINSLEAAHKKIIALTAHRRESFGQGLKNIFESVTDFALRHNDATIIYPVHPNPAIKETIMQTTLEQTPNILCIDPLPYHEMIFLMSKADLIITDSGGIQEEAVSLGKKVLITRTQTERQEGVDAGRAALVGTDKKILLDALEKQYALPASTTPTTIYGQGDACLKIVSHLCAITHNGFSSEKITMNNI